MRATAALGSDATDAALTAARPSVAILRLTLQIRGWGRSAAVGAPLDLAATAAAPAAADATGMTLADLLPFLFAA